MAISAEAIGAGDAHHQTLRSIGLQAARCPLGPRTKRVSQKLVVIAGIAGAAGVAGAVAGVSGHWPLFPPTALAVVAAAASVAAWVAVAARARLDVLAGAFDAGPEAQLLVSANGVAARANPAFARLFAGAGKPSLDLIERAAASPEAAAAFRALREQAAAGAAAAARIPVRLAADGLERDIAVSVRPDIGRSGYRLWTVRDVGVLARPQTLPAEPVLLLTPPTGGPAGTWRHDSVQPFFDEAPVGIAIVDRLGRFTKANRALGELFGAPPESLTGRGLIVLLDPEDRAVVAARLADAAIGRKNGTPIEIRLAAPGERTMVLLLSHVDREPAEKPAADGDTPIVATVASGPAADGAQRDDAAADNLTLYFIDVTEQKQLETQFAQSQKMQAIGQLAGGVAHDFNNLLTAMIGFCDLLLLRSRPGDPAFADIMQIKQNANRAANLVRQLLAFSRQQSLQPQVLDITDVLSELSHLLRRLIGENIELEFVHGHDLGLVKVDQGQLEQVVINLAVNARDAMPDGGRLTIRTENVHQPCAVRRRTETMPAGDYVLIEVTDTGIGIAPDTLARIFEPFFSTKSVGSGTGLGLSTVYGIVKQTGGFVFVDSCSGRGATFSIYLPRHETANAPAPAPDAAWPEPAIARDLTGSDTIMLVEDDDAVRMFGARALRNKGYRVIEAKSGESALERIRNGADSIDLVITDVVMPQMDGPALVRELREMDPEIKVIFISGYAEDGFRQRLDQDRDIHFLPKPFNLKQLALKVKDVLGSELGARRLPDCMSEQNVYTPASAARCTAAPAVK
jgi:PAS domain S-box-containing protein